MMMKQYRRQYMPAAREQSPTCNGDGCKIFPSDANGCVSAGSYADFPLAMVFTPNQPYEKLYSPAEALSKGTLFAQLELPFHGKFRI